MGTARCVLKPHVLTRQDDSGMVIKTATFFSLDTSVEDAVVPFMHPLIHPGITENNNSIFNTFA